MSMRPGTKPAGATAGDPPARVTSPPKTTNNSVQTGSLASFMGSQLGVKHTGQSSGMIKKQDFDDAAERAFHANKPANEGMAKAFAAMVMSSAKPVGTQGMKLPSQIIKEQKSKGPAAPAVVKTASEQKAKQEEKEKKERDEREKKEKADKELKAKADAPKPVLAKTGSEASVDKAKKEKEEKEKREKEERERKAKAEKEKAEKTKKELEEAKKKASEAVKKPMSFGVDRSKSPAAAERAASPAKAATVIVVKEEARGKSPAKAEEVRPKSPEKKLEPVVEVVIETKRESSAEGHVKLEKDRWYVEGYDGNTHAEPIIVKVDSPKESVYVGKCTNGVVVQVEGKCKSLQVNSCADVGLVCETVVATVEIMNSQKCQIQTTGIVNLIQLDNCERCKLFLSKDSLEADCKVFTAKSSATLVYTPTDDGEDMLEMSLPEQFVSTMHEDGSAIRHEIVMPEAVLS